MMHLEMQPVDYALEQRHEAVAVRLRHLVTQLHGRAEPASRASRRGQCMRAKPSSVAETVGDGLAPRRQGGRARSITRPWWAERVCLVCPSVAGVSVGKHHGMN
jgi:hypothetical protein